MPPRQKPITVASLRRIALALPRAEEGTSYGTPAWRSAKKLVARLHQNGKDVVLPIDRDAREALIASDPDSFHVTDHYLAYDWVLARLDIAPEAVVRMLLADATSVSVSPKRSSTPRAKRASPKARRGGSKP